MSKFQIIFGAILTLALNAILLLTVLGEPIRTYGFIGAAGVIFTFVSMVRIIIGNATKNDSPTDWKSIGSFVLGAFIATVVVLSLGLAAII